MSLLTYGRFGLHSGAASNLKIDCDFLSDSDIITAASMLWRSIPGYSLVIGIPSGGMRLANEMKKYKPKPDETRILICDDVYTTGASMEQYRAALNSSYEVIGVVLFARAETPAWITPLFQLNPAIKHDNNV